MAGSASDAEFQWGNKEAGTDSSYESMCLYGIWYHLYDCVLCKSGMRMPFVGKLMRLFEDENGVRKARIRWFFRLYELPKSVVKDLSRDCHNSNELFIALGNVKGVENENVVEVICGKVTVLCTARYVGNVMPSTMHIDAADYVFYRAYDVANKKIMKMANISNKHLAQKFANKAEWMPTTKIAEVEESTTFVGGESSIAIMNSSATTIKHQLSRSATLDFSTSASKKLKGKEKIIDLDLLSN